MKFLINKGKLVDMRFGSMCGPLSVMSGVKAGMLWASDAGPFTNTRADEARYTRWLQDVMIHYRSTCLFLVVPGKPQDVVETKRLFEVWSTRPMFRNWPLAFAAQDGQEDFEFPDTNRWDTLLVGGSLAWRGSDAAKSVIQAAQQLGKRIHIERVNFWRQYFHFAQMSGSRCWTCDGTRYNVWGDSVLEEWLSYEQAYYGDVVSLTL